MIPLRKLSIYASQDFSNLEFEYSATKYHIWAFKENAWSHRLFREMHKRLKSNINANSYQKK